MHDAEILKLLATMGIDELSYKALPLLPLLQVAWADGTLQEEERAVVQQVIDEARLGSEATRLVANWLTYPPSQDYLDRGRAALVALALRGGEMSLEQEVLADVIKMSREVARAAGGLWGLGAISREERTALDQIAEALHLTDGTAWAERVSRELAEEPPRQRVRIRFDTNTLDLGEMPGILVPVYDDRLEIPVEGTLVLGADPSCEVWVDGAGVAPRHCEIRAERSRFYLRDLDSPTGTWLDGERVLERRLLGGEILRLGDAELRFQLLRRVPDQLL